MGGCHPGTKPLTIGRLEVGNGGVAQQIFLWGPIKLKHIALMAQQQNSIYLAGFVQITEGLTRNYCTAGTQQLRYGWLGPKRLPG
jgi:hypothetical protein